MDVGALAGCARTAVLAIATVTIALTVALTLLSLWDTVRPQRTLSLGLHGAPESTPAPRKLAA